MEAAENANCEGFMEKSRRFADLDNLVSGVLEKRIAEMVISRTPFELAL